MPSPYGSRGASSYYQHAGMPTHYVYDWSGMPQGSERGAESRALGDYLDITARFHKDLSGVDYPVSMSMESGTRSVLHSGPEQTHIYDSAPLGALSDNEKKFGIITLAGIAGFFIWKKYFK